MVDSVSLHDKIANLLSERIHVEAPSSSTDLMEAGLLDSLTLVELIVGLEEEFGLKIPFDEVELDNFRSVESIATFIAGRSVLEMAPA
jgi:acyl carrier protein